MTGVRHQTTGGSLRSPESGAWNITVRREPCQASYTEIRLEFNPFPPSSNLCLLGLRLRLKLLKDLLKFRWVIRLGLDQQGHKITVPVQCQQVESLMLGKLSL